MSDMDAFEEWLDNGGGATMTVYDMGNDPSGCLRQAFEAGQRSRDEEVEKLKGIVSGKTFYDIEKVTAMRCAEICHSIDSEHWFKNQSLMADAIQSSIKEEFKLD